MAMKESHKIIAEQFTDDNIPQGVIPAPLEILVLLKDLIPEITESETYIYRVPVPKQDEKILANQIGAPYPFHLIKKGDYVVTFQDQPSAVLEEEAFIAIPSWNLTHFLKYRNRLQRIIDSW